MPRATNVVCVNFFHQHAALAKKAQQSNHFPTLPSIEELPLDSDELLEEALANSEFDMKIDLEIELEEPKQPFDGIIPKDKLDIKFARSSGPGGQNVNKVSTKADVRFNVNNADWLPPAVKQRLHSQQAHRINNSGELVVQASSHRTQEQNVKDALQRIKTLVKTKNNS